MTPFILYQLKAGLAIMMFTGLYYTLLRKETFYRYNRIYLVTSLLVSELIPAIEFPSFNTPGTTEFGQLIASATYIAAPAVTTTPVQHFPVMKLTYIIVAFLFALFLLIQVIRLLSLFWRRGSFRLNQFWIVTLPVKSHSFSFFNLIFLSSSTAVSEDSSVLKHELVHARQLHSLDILLVEIIKILQWFNPFIYLAGKALQETHEYLADEAVLEQNGESDRYRLLLLTQALGVQPGILSFFNYSLIKNRLTMMTKEKSPLRNRLKYLLVIPLIAVIGVLLNCANEKTDVPSLSDEFNEGVDVTQMTDDDSVYVLVDEQAKFMGGTLETFRDWVQENVRYPDDAIKNGITGKVTVTFAVDSKGKISNVKILRGVEKSLDMETIRVLESSPEWVPAKVKGIDVKQQFVMPVVFALSDTPSKDKVLSPPPPAKPSTEESVAAAKEGKVIFADVNAQFQGGSLEKFREWVQRNVEYPEEAIKKGIFGRVTVQFTVTTEGKVEDVKVLRGVDLLLDKESIRVITSSPIWKPGENDGAPINQQFVMPVIFQLQ
jgi:TonB family protein